MNRKKNTKEAGNQSIDRMFQIIGVLSEAKHPMRLNDISDACHIPSSSVMRILNAMILNGYVMQDQETYLYSLSYKFVIIGNNIRDNLSINRIIHPYLTEISKQTEISSALSVCSGNTVTYIDEVIASNQMVIVTHHLGTPFPLHITACGKLFLSEFSQEQFSKYFHRINLERITPKTICTELEMKTEILNIRKNGYAINNQESLLGMKCIAFPIRTSSGEIIASLSISGTVYQITDENTPLLLSTMLKIINRLHKECQPLLDNALLYK